MDDLYKLLLKITLRVAKKNRKLKSKKEQE